MKQSRLMSLIEAVANVVVGYGIAVATQLVVFPWFGLPAHLDDALALGAVFTAMSILRSYLLRRAFETLRCGSPPPRAERACGRGEQQDGGSQVQRATSP